MRGIPITVAPVIAIPVIPMTVTIVGRAPTRSSSYAMIGMSTRP